MGTGYVFTDTATFRSDLNTEIKAALYFRYDYTETDTSMTIQAVSAGLVYRKARTTDPDSTFRLLKDSTATKNVITPNGKEHRATVTRTTNRSLTITGSGSAFQSFGTFENMSYTVSKTTAIQTVQMLISGKAIVSSDYAPTVIFTKSGSMNQAVPKLASYTVTLNANGGVNVINSFTKYYGITARFPSSPNLPTRTNYTFRGWAASSSATTPAYTSGVDYTANASATLYAIWSRVLHLTYNSNGGSGVSNTVEQTVWNAVVSSSFRITEAKPTRAGYLFKGWSTSSTATSATYQPGGTIVISSDTTLYAVWNPDPTLGVSTTSTENSYTIYTSVNSEVTRQVKIYENGTLISTNDVKGNNSFTFTGKKPEASYTIKVDLLEGSAVIATKTVTVSTLNADISLTGDNADSTYTSVKATASGMKESENFVKTIEWQYALASSPNDKTTFCSETLGTNATSNVATITGLLPGRTYNITAIYYVDGYQTDAKTITLSTPSISGRLNVSERSISTIIAALRGLTQIDYALKVKVSYKETTASEWILQQTHTIYANAQADVLTTISALTPNTSYDIKAEVLRASDDALISTFTLEASTRPYIPHDAPVPFIDAYICVPHSRVAAIKWHAEGDVDGYTFTLWEIIPTAHGESVVYFDTLTGDHGVYSFYKSQTMTRKYAISAVDSESHEHNRTDSVSMVFENLTFYTYDPDEPVMLEANYVFKVADAACRAYEYEELIGTNEEGEGRQIYERLKMSIDQAVKGELIRGQNQGSDIYPVLYYIGCSGVDHGGHPWIGQSDVDPVTATEIARNFGSARMKLESLRGD